MSERKHPPSADSGLDKVDRGQRVSGETRFRAAHDGVDKSRFVRPHRGELPADMTNSGGPHPATVEDVVEAPGSASSWEAIENDPSSEPARSRGVKRPGRAGEGRSEE